MRPPTAPTKWQKYLKLVEYDLVRLEDLEAEIHRYPWAQRYYLIADLRKDLAVENQKGQQNIYVVKLVSILQQGQLPNFRVVNSTDADQLSTFLEDNGTGRYEEAWYCQTRIDHGVFSVAGRVIFRSDVFQGAQVVEQVWRCSPRRLENLCSG